MERMVRGKATKGFQSPLFAHDAEASRRVIRGQLVAAVGAINVGGADCAEAGAAVCGELKVALGTEVEVALNVRAAGRAVRDLGLAQEKIQNSADAGGHDEADDHPEPQAHCAARGIFADVADHKEVEGGDDSPGDVEVDAQAERRRRVMALLGRDDPEIVFDEDKRQAGEDD